MESDGDPPTSAGGESRSRKTRLDVLDVTQDSRICDIIGSTKRRRVKVLLVENDEEDPTNREVELEAACHHLQEELKMAHLQMKELHTRLYGQHSSSSSNHTPLADADAAAQEQAAAALANLQNQLKTSKDTHLKDMQNLSDLLECGCCRHPLWHPRLLIECGHVFCESCLASWFRASHTSGMYSCPECRKGIRVRPVEFYFAREIVGKVYEARTRMRSNGQEEGEENGQEEMEGDPGRCERARATLENLFKSGGVSRCPAAVSRMNVPPPPAGGGGQRVVGMPGGPTVHYITPVRGGAGGPPPPPVVLQAHNRHYANPNPQNPNHPASQLPYQVHQHIVHASQGQPSPFFPPVPPAAAALSAANAMLYQQIAQRQQQPQQPPPQQQQQGNHNMLPFGNAPHLHPQQPLQNQNVDLGPGMLPIHHTAHQFHRHPEQQNQLSNNNANRWMAIRSDHHHHHHHPTPPTPLLHQIMREDNTNPTSPSDVERAYYERQQAYAVYQQQQQQQQQRTAQTQTGVQHQHFVPASVLEGMQVPVPDDGRTTE